MMGRVVAKDLLQTESDAAVTLLDCRAGLLREAAEFIADARLKPEQLDVRETDRAARMLEGHRAAIGALPHRCSLDGLAAAIAAGVPTIDLVGSDPERRQEFEQRVQEVGILVVPG